MPLKACFLCKLFFRELREHLGSSECPKETWSANSSHGRGRWEMPPSGIPWGLATCWASGW